MPKTWNRIIFWRSYAGHFGEPWYGMVIGYHWKRNGGLVLFLGNRIAYDCNLTQWGGGSTELKDYVYEGIIPDGPTLNGPWTSVIRVFKRHDGVTLMLREWDYVADGGAIVTINELMNVTVANVPAMLMVKKSPSGKTITELDWSTDKKHFTITVLDDVDTKHKGKAYDRKWLVNLANSIS